MKKTINLHLRSTDDWEALYYNGHKIAENHRLTIEQAFQVINDFDNLEYDETTHLLGTSTEYLEINEDEIDSAHPNLFPERL